MAERRKASVNQKAGSIQDRDINEMRSRSGSYLSLCVRARSSFSVGRVYLIPVRLLQKGDTVDIKSPTFEKWKWVSGVV
jgi:hypothetical protein